MGLNRRSSVRGDPMTPAYVRPSGAPGSRFTVKFSVGFYENVPLATDAATEEDATAEFLTFLFDDELVKASDPWSVPYPGMRRVRMRIRGVPYVLVFRAAWVAGFTVERS